MSFIESNSKIAIHWAIFHGKGYLNRYSLDYARISLIDNKKDIKFLGRIELEDQKLPYEPLPGNGIKGTGTLDYYDSYEDGTRTENIIIRDFNLVHVYYPSNIDIDDDVNKEIVIYQGELINIADFETHFIITLKRVIYGADFFKQDYAYKNPQIKISEIRYVESIFVKISIDCFQNLSFSSGDIITLSGQLIDDNSWGYTVVDIKNLKKWAYRIKIPSPIKF